MLLTDKVIENNEQTSLSRREFLNAAALIPAGLVIAPKFPFCKPLSAAKKLFMHNIHTGEYVNLTYMEKGAYIPDALAELNNFFRDRMTNEQRKMDPKLLDLIHSIYEETESGKPLEIVSGYRCPSTNAKLRKKSKGVAKNSYHMKGMAADLFIPGVDLAKLRKLACSKGAGGVGYYPRSGFVHVDVRSGPKKRWQKIK